MQKSTGVSILVGVMALLYVPLVQAEVRLPAVISSHMVLQREKPVPLWGTAGAGEKVTVKFRDQEKSAVADARGKWSVKLDPLQAGGPNKLTVTGVNQLILEDVLVGEVWVGAGQSNMALPASPALASNDVGLAKALAGAPYPHVRLLNNGPHGLVGWQVATRENIQAFSALLFSFGLPLQQKLNVPVGLLVGAVGGTASGNWLSQAAYTNDAACKEAAARFATTYSLEEAQKMYAAELRQFNEKEAEREKNQPGSPKGKAPIPVLRPGESFVPIGNLFEKHIRPLIPYAIHGVLWDQGESGTAVLGVDQFVLTGALIRGWRQEWGQDDFPFLYMQKPSGGGCAWDPSDPVTCKAEVFATLPSSVPADDNLRPNHSLRSRERYREDYLRIRQYPVTTLVTTMDLGGGTHPVNKSGYGVRACRTALGAVYGENIEVYGPLYHSLKVEGNTIIIRFTHLGQGLAFKHGAQLQGFAIAGADQKFVWADAVIGAPAGPGALADTVMVSSDKVPNPVAVRYAWANWHPWANLFNKDGMPALPFRTDDWPEKQIPLQGK